MSHEQDALYLAGLVGADGLNRGSKWTQKQEDQLRQLVMAGAPRHVIARELGRSQAAISARALALGLHIEPPSVGRRLVIGREA